VTRSKPYKRKKRGAGRFVQLSEKLQKTETWALLKPGPRALYVEIRRRFNGYNNGRIVLSHREAASALNVHRNTVGPWFNTLIEQGFIRLTSRSYLGPDGVGRAALIALTEEACDGKPATRDFERWKAKQKPRTKNRTARHKNCASEDNTAVSSAYGVTKTVT